MVRAVIGVIVGYAIWTVLWLGGNAAIFGALSESLAAGEALTDPGPFVGVLVLSVVCSLAAGLACAATAAKRARSAVVIMSVLLLVTGIGVQASVWDLMPTWYHLTFLGMIVPVCVGAGRLRSGTSHAEA